MRVIDESDKTFARFRCDLCGRFSNFGVAETQAERDHTTRVCSDCVVKALNLLLGHIAELTRKPKEDNDQ